MLLFVLIIFVHKHSCHCSLLSFIFISGDYMLHDNYACVCKQSHRRTEDKESEMEKSAVPFVSSISLLFTAVIFRAFGLHRVKGLQSNSKILEILKFPSFSHRLFPFIWNYSYFL